MKTIRPYKGIYKLKIHRHSKVRYRQSKHILDTEIGFVAYIEPPYFEVFTGRKWPSLVTDLKRVPKKPIKSYSSQYQWAEENNISLTPIHTKKLGIFRNIVYHLRRKK